MADPSRMSSPVAGANVIPQPDNPRRATSFCHRLCDLPAPERAGRPQAAPGTAGYAPVVACFRPPVLESAFPGGSDQQNRRRLPGLRGQAAREGQSDGVQITDRKRVSQHGDSTAPSWRSTLWQAYGRRARYAEPRPAFTYPIHFPDRTARYRTIALPVQTPSRRARRLRHGLARRPATPWY